MFGQGQYEFVRNLPAQKSQEYGKPKNLPEQGCCIVGMGQTSNTSAVHEILERSKKDFVKRKSSWHLHCDPWHF